jgi:uncharacterized OB-fold protein
MTTRQELLSGDAAKQYWAALDTGLLSLPRCDACFRLIWYPRAHCPRCMSVDLHWEVMSGHGLVYSYTVNRRGQGAQPSQPPPLIAYVELAEGPRIIAHVVDVEMEELAIGAAVTLVSAARRARLEEPRIPAFAPSTVR